MSNKKIISHAFLVTTFFAAVLMFILANSLPINGVTTMQVYANNQTLFNPANYTHYIWIVLALMQLVYILYALGIFKRKCISGNAIIVTSAFASLFNLLTIGWIIVWQFNLVFIGVLINILMGVCLFLLNTNLQTLKVRGACTLLTTVPFLATLSWITFLTSLNFFILFVSLNLVQNIAIWAIVNLAITTIIAVITGGTFACLFYIGFMIWSYIGLLVQHLTVYNSAYIDIIYAIVVAMFLLILTAVFIIYSYTRHSSKTLAKIIEED